MSSLTIHPKADPPREVEAALDRCVCYPSEEVTFFVRGPQKEGEATIFIKLPGSVEVLSNGVENAQDVRLHTYGGSNSHFFSLSADMRKHPEFQIRVRTSGLKIDHYLVFSAWAADSAAPDDEIPDSAARVRLAIKTNAAFLRYLPEIYSYDNFMNRFLMFFESFWKPINQQIGQIEYYFDPDLTPEAFLPWLGTWVGLKTDPSFPREKRREMIKDALPFYKYRGTLQSLKDYLEFYSSGKVTIRELKAENMILGEETRLGEGIALGHENRPNTVEIQVSITREELTRTGFDKNTYTQKLQELTRTIVPAHTIYHIQLNVAN